MTCGWDSSTRKVKGVIPGGEVSLARYRPLTKGKLAQAMD